MQKNKDIKFHFQRFEFKYLININQKRAIFKELTRHYMQPDEFSMGCPQDAYWVNSIYFESPNFKCYREKVYGVKNRFKLRLRFYGNDIKKDGPAFLEIKRKVNNVVIKDRMIVEPAAIDDFLNNNIYLGRGGATEKEQEVIDKFYYLYRRFAMRPLLGVRYRRQPMVGRFDKKLRVTFDYDLEAYLYKDSLRKRQLDNSIVLEIKCNNTLPAWLAKIIQKYGLQKTSFSKYANCLEATNLKLNYKKYA